MLTVKNSKYQDQISFDKKAVSTLLKGSELEYLLDTNELDENTFVTFNEILENADAVRPDDADEEKHKIRWNTFKSYLSSKTSFDMIKGIDDTISVLTRDIPGQMVMDRIRRYILTGNVSRLIADLGLQKVYEQLVFYEYIYMSELVTLTTKLRIMTENNYIELMNMLEDGYLEISTTSQEPENVKEELTELLSIRHDCYHSNRLGYQNHSMCTPVIIFNRFIELHKNWISCELQQLDEVDRSVKLLKTLCLKNFDSFDDDRIHNNMNFNSVFDLDDLCLMNTIYAKNKKIVTKLITFVIDRLNHLISIGDRDIRDRLRFYRGIDLIVKLMEEDHILINNFSKNNRSKILAFWLKFNSPTDPCFKKNLTYPHFDTEHNGGMRDLVLSKTVVSTLNDMSITFQEMCYVLSADRLDIFQILCKNLNFKTVHPMLYTYLPPTILEYVLEKRGKAGHAYDNHPAKTHITINPYNLRGQTPGSLEPLIKTIERALKNETLYDFVSISDRYSYVECSYIVMYWDYLHLLIHDKNIIDNLMVVLKSIDPKKLSDHYLDVLILKTVIDNYFEEEDRTYREYAAILSQVLKHIKIDYDVMTSKYDFADIRTEFVNFGVKNLEEVDNMIKAYDMFEGSQTLDKIIKMPYSKLHAGRADRRRTRARNQDDEAIDENDDENDDENEEDEQDNDFEDNEEEDSEYEENNHSIDD
jgi:hypothetical protein